MNESVEIPDSARDRHIYIAGKQGSGKSLLIFWMALQDIDQGKGVCVLDPHGDLVEQMIHYIPEHRVNDTLYLDFTQPIPLDFFHTETFKEKEYLADDIIGTFRRLSGGDWGIRMDSILRNVTGALLSVPGMTFLDIHRVMTDKGFRDKTIPQINNEHIRRYFAEGGEFDKERSDSKLAITSRITKFLLTPALKTIVGHPQPKLRIPELIKTKKVLLVNLNKVGEETKTILGTLLVAKIQRVAMGRKPEDRIPFYLYADEFHRFQTSSFEEIISEARKFKLCLTLAHQGIWQLDSVKLRHAVRMITTLLLFNVEEETARFFRSELQGDFELQQLERGQAVYRKHNGYTTLIDTPAPPHDSEQSFAEIIRNRTIELYSCPLAEIALASKEEEIPPSRPKRAVTKNATHTPPRPHSEDAG
jgi:hypothetical protein